jgi:serine/threonine-protein kinase
MSEALHPASLPVASARFGKYTLLRRIAQGGMAEIFLALQRSVLPGSDTPFEKLIVIKRILPELTGDKQFAEMLLHEAQIAATLGHPNIVQVFDAGQIEGRYFIAMEHVHGEDLRAIVRQMKKKDLLEFSIEHAIAIVLGACAGLSYAHEKRGLDGAALGIVHRDVSPQNIVVTFDGDVKVVDFGIAHSHARRSEENTKSGKLKGKVPYMSPEQARGEPLDARSDLFSLGTILFELTTGKRLFKGQSEFETLKLICDREYPRPSEVKPGYPADLEPIVMKALAKDVEHRYASGRELQADLEAFVRTHRLAVSRLSLEKFMRDLFCEQLAREEEALREGKRLAEAIHVSDAPETSNALELSAVQRISRVIAPPPPPGRSPAVLAFAVIIAIAAAALALLLR